MPFLARTAGAITLAAGAAAFAVPMEARAATADVFGKGRVYCATTHPNHGTIAGFGPAVDLNARTDDTGWPLYAPGEGRVRIHSAGGGFGLSVIWTAANGRERIHLAHLGSFGHTGRVRAGELIGRIGSTGQSTGSHLHAAASVADRPAGLVLGDRAIRPGRCYESRGPIPPRCGSRDATMVGTGRGERLVTGAGRDRVAGGAGDDTICAGGGSDLLVGGRGSDLLRAGAARDRLLGEGGGDRLVGGPAGDRLRGAARSDSLAGGQGDDLLVGGGGGDRIRGEGKDDGLLGGTGADRLSAGRGSDRLAGGGGDDRLAGNGGLDRLAGVGGDDELKGGRASDIAVYTRSAVGVIADLAVGSASGDGEDILIGMEGLQGSAHDDSLRGDGEDNEIRGGAGDDLLDGLTGDDRLYGGGGFDTCLNATARERCEAEDPPKATTGRARSR